jgi:MarR family transcriptional regulator, transcriptional regulator for hemolysin
MCRPVQWQKSKPVRSDQARAAADPAAVGRTFGFLVQDVARLLKRHFERRARQTGLPLTRRQAAVLVHVSRRQGVSQAEIAALLDMEAISLVRMLDRLCDEGLVERRAHPTDRRVRTLWLTAGAQPVLARILEINLEIRAEAFDGLPAEARDSLIDTLAVIKCNLSMEDDPEAQENLAVMAGPENLAITAGQENLARAAGEVETRSVEGEGDRVGTL